jgi:hypothetical protein
VAKAATLWFNRLRSIYGLRTSARVQPNQIDYTNRPSSFRGRMTAPNCDLASSMTGRSNLVGSPQTPWRSPEEQVLAATIWLIRHYRPLYALLWCGSKNRSHWEQTTSTSPLAILWF